MQVPDPLQQIVYVLAALGTILTSGIVVYRWLRPPATEPGGLVSAVPSPLPPPVPAIVATVDWHYFELAPDVKQRLREQVSIEELGDWVKFQREIPIPRAAADVLDSFVRHFTSSEAVELRRARYVDQWDIELSIVVRNDGPVAATEARLMLPGNGVALVSQNSISFSGCSIVNWNGEIPVGNLLPHSKTSVRIWKKGYKGDPLKQTAVVFNGGHGSVITPNRARKES